MSNRHYFVALLLAIATLSACGVKGGLKTPSQIKAQELKKAKKQRETPEPAEEMPASNPPESGELIGNPSGAAGGK